MEKHTCTRSTTEEREGESSFLHVVPSVSTLVEELLKKLEKEESHLEMDLETKSVEEVGENRPLNKITSDAARQNNSNTGTKEHCEGSPRNECLNVKSVVVVPVPENVNQSVAEDSQGYCYSNTVQNIVEDLLIEATNIVNESNHLTKLSKESIVRSTHVNVIGKVMIIAENTKGELVHENNVTDDTNDNMNDSVRNFTEPSNGKNETKYESTDFIINKDEHDHPLNHETESTEDKDANNSEEMEQDGSRNNMNHCENSMDFSDSARKDETMMEDANDEHSKDDNRESTKSSKAKKKKADRKSKDKDEKNSIHSETQRIIRGKNQVKTGKIMNKLSQDKDET